MTVISSPKAIEIFSLSVLKSALTLEMKGLRRKGPSALAIAKQRLGLSGGTAKTVLPLLVAHVQHLENDYATAQSEARLARPFYDEGAAAARCSGLGMLDCPYETTAPQETELYKRTVRARTAWMEGFQNAQVAA